MGIDSGTLNRRIFRLALPAMGENVLHVVVFLVDALMVSWLGTRALAAVGQGGLLGMMVTFVFLSIAVASTALVARHYGAGRHEQANEAAGQSMTLGLALGLVLTVPMCLGAQPLLIWMNTPDDVLQEATVYLVITMLGLTFRFLMFAGAGALRGAGNTLIPMLVVLLMNATNIFLNWLLIFGRLGMPRLGVAGAAIGTTVSHGLGAVVLVAVLASRLGPVRVGLRHLVPIRARVMATLVRLCWPAALEQFFTQVGYFFFVRIVAGLGTVSLAAHNIAVRIEAVALIPALGFSVVTATLTGQHLGAGQPALAMHANRRSMWFSLGAMSVLGALFLLVPGVLASPFMPEPDVRRLVVVCVMIASIEQPVLAWLWVYSGALRGAGDTVTPMIVALGGVCVVRLPASYACAYLFDLGLPGVWLATVADWMCRTLVIYLVYRQGRWQRVRLGVLGEPGVAGLGPEQVEPSSAGL